MTDFFILMSVFSLVLHLNAESIKKKHIGLVPKSDLEKALVVFLDKQLIWSFVWALFGVMTVL